MAEAGAEPSEHEKPSWRRDDRTRLSIALALSLSLHLAAIAFLAVFIAPAGMPSGRWTGSPDAALVVSIAKPESRGRPVAHPLKQVASKRAPYDSKTRLAARNPAQNDTNSSQHNTGLPGVYFPASELDALPVIRRDVDLYPSELHSLKHGGGKAVLRLWIDETGRVAKAEPVSSDLPAVVAEVAARVFLQADFLPGRKNGFAVKSKVEAVLVYPPRDSS